MEKAFHNHIILGGLFEFLRIPHSQIPTFYCLPKTHKGPGPLSACPIVSGIGSIDTVLVRTHVLTLSSYIKDTGSFLRSIEGMQIPSGSLLVTLDVEALYNSIPHTKGVALVGEFLAQMGHDLGDLNKFVLGLLSFILEHNVPYSSRCRGW